MFLTRHRSFAPRCTKHVENLPAFWGSLTQQGSKVRGLNVLIRRHTWSNDCKSKARVLSACQLTVPAEQTWNIRVLHKQIMLIACVRWQKLSLQRTCCRPRPSMVSWFNNNSSNHKHKSTTKPTTTTTVATSTPPPPPTTTTRTRTRTPTLLVRAPGVLLRWHGFLGQEGEMMEYFRRLFVCFCYILRVVWEKFTKTPKCWFDLPRYWHSPKMPQGLFNAVLTGPGILAFCLIIIWLAH